MPVPAPNLYPEFNVIRLSHLYLNVKDLVASKPFYVDTLGLQVNDKNKKTCLSARNGVTGASLPYLAKIRCSRNV